MASGKPSILELSPSFKERMKYSLLAIIGLIVGIIAVTGSLIIDMNTMAKFAAIFIGALFIFFSLWRILRISTIKLYIDPEEIRYRDRFVWKKINWSDVISVGRVNDIQTKDHKSAIRKVKSIVFLTDSGMKQFDLSAYSLNHGIDTVNKVIDSHPNRAHYEEAIVDN
ncbi:MAG: hypothetical protein ACTSQN_13235 [Candidatus Heimdallarchaeota archaeon]